MPVTNRGPDFAFASAVLFRSKHALGESIARMYRPCILGRALVYGFHKASGMVTSTTRTLIINTSIEVGSRRASPSPAKKKPGHFDRACEQLMSHLVMVVVSPPEVPSVVTPTMMIVVIKELEAEERSNT